MSDAIGVPAESVRAICQAHVHQRGPMLEILHALQREYGFVPESAFAVIADALNVSRAEVYGVFSFYHDLRDQPAPRHRIKVCRAEACQSMGGRAVWEAAEQAAATAPAVEVEEVYCLGNCACSPAVQIDERTRGRVNPEAIGEWVERLNREGRT